MENLEVSQTQWTLVAPDRFQTCGATVRQLPPGAYSLHLTMTGIEFERRELRVDELIDFPGIQSPDAKLRDLYLQRKAPDLTQQQRQQWVDLTSDLSFAALTELVISVLCLGNDLKATVKLLRDLETRTETPGDEIWLTPANGKSGKRHKQTQYDDSDDIPF